MHLTFSKHARCSRSFYHYLCINLVLSDVCEVDKYSRVKHPELIGKTGRSRIKQKFKQNSLKIELMYPPKWGINEKMNNFLKTI